jgi:hypothetical protein
MIAYADPGIELHSAFGAIDGDVYRGHDEVRRWHRDVWDVWGDEDRLEPEAYFDLGEQTLAFYVASGRGRQSGVEITGAFAQLVKWRNGLIVYSKGYANREDALSDLGVCEDELEPIAP